jgi:hypothetical protein
MNKFVVSIAMASTFWLGGCMTPTSVGGSKTMAPPPPPQSCAINPLNPLLCTIQISTAVDPLGARSFGLSTEPSLAPRNNANFVRLQWQLPPGFGFFDLNASIVFPRATLQSPSITGGGAGFEWLVPPGTALDANTGKYDIIMYERRGDGSKGQGYKCDPTIINFDGQSKDPPPPPAMVPGATAGLVGRPIACTKFP